MVVGGPCGFRLADESAQNRNAGEMEEEEYSDSVKKKHATTDAWRSGTE